MPVVVCDASPLMALGKLNRLGLLADLYKEVQIPRAVYDEVVTQGLARGASDALIVRLFWQRQRWPIVDVPDAVLSAYTPPVVLLTLPQVWAYFRRKSVSHLAIKLASIANCNLREGSLSSNVHR